MDRNRSVVAARQAAREAARRVAKAAARAKEEKEEAIQEVAREAAKAEEKNRMLWAEREAARESFLRAEREAFLMAEADAFREAEKMAEREVLASTPAAHAMHHAPSSRVHAFSALTGPCTVCNCVRCAGGQGDAAPAGEGGGEAAGAAGDQGGGQGNGAREGQGTEQHRGWRESGRRERAAEGEKRRLGGYHAKHATGSMGASCSTLPAPACTRRFANHPTRYHRSRLVRPARQQPAR